MYFLKFQTRLMNQKRVTLVDGINSAPKIYKGSVDCFVQVSIFILSIKKEIFLKISISDRSK